MPAHADLTPHPRPGGAALGRAALVAASAAVAAATLDLHLGLNAHGATRDLGHTLHPLATDLAAFLALGAAALVAALPLRRLVPEGARLAGAAALVLGVFAATALEYTESTRLDRARFAAALGVAVGLAALVAFAARRARPGAVVHTTVALGWAAALTLAARLVAPPLAAALGRPWPKVVARFEAAPPSLDLAALGLVGLAGVLVVVGSRRRRTGVALALLAGATLAAGFLRGPQPTFVDRRGAPGAAPGSEVRRIVLIVIDTLRRDKLSSYDDGAPATPAIAALAADSLQFEDARAPAPWTLPSMATLFTGVAPDIHLATQPDRTIPRALPTLAERLGAVGYRTAAIGENPMLARGTGAERGFDEHDWHPALRPRPPAAEFILTHLGVAVPPRSLDAERLTDRAIDWVARHGSEDFFLWLHYFDTHLGYAPPSDLAPPPDSRTPVGSSFWDLFGARSGQVGHEPAERARIQALYDAEVQGVDRQVGRLLADLKARGLYDGTLIVLTSDHGEEHWDHGGFEHGHSLYDELLRVPLLMKLPGSTARGSVDGLAGLAGLHSTLLALAGVPHEPVEETARPIWPRAEGAPSAPRYYSGRLYFGAATAVIDGSLKYLSLPLEGREELYDIAADPRESRSLSSTAPEVLARLRGLAEARAAVTAGLRSELGVERTLAPDDQAREAALRSLGYVK